MVGRISICLISGIIGCTSTKEVYLCNACPETLVIDMVEVPWEYRDFLAVETAKATCERDYGPENPCVAQFTRFEPGSYNVICGHANQFKCKEPKQ